MTALAQMAAARPPGIADTRVPCPLCGGLIHPVAGRCKHCKEDLSSFRAGRPQAAAALPALNGRPAAQTNATTNGSNGHAVATAIPLAIPTHEASQPILPPRTTARSVPVQRPSHSIWRSWPMLVIVLAVIAIVAATVIMIIPPGSKKHDGKMSAPPGPAFERMETNPLPDKSSQLDPWDNGAQGTVPRTPDPQPQAPPVDPDDDLWGSGGGGIGGGGIAGGSFGMTGNAFMIHVLDRACKKLKTCPDLDQTSLSTICESVAMMPKPPAPTCDAAKKCFDAIDRLSCSQASSQDLSPVSIFGLFEDCRDGNSC